MLVYDATMKHHEYDTMQISIEESKVEKEIVASIRVSDQSISLTKSEIETVFLFVQRFHAAQEAFGDDRPDTRTA